MKTYLKKVSALFIAFVMMLAMSVPAFAADPDSATIFIDNAENATLKYVQVIEPDRTSETGWKFSSSEIATAYKNAFDLNEDQAVIKALIDTVEVDGLANTAAISKALSNVRNDSSIVKQEMENPQTVYNAGVYAIFGEEDGYSYNNMAAYIGFGKPEGGVYPALVSKEIDAKKSPDEVTKEQDETDNAAAIGDVVEYTITSTVPFIDKVNSIHKNYKIVDKITGAEYVLNTDKVVDVTVTMGGNTVNGYTVTMDTEDAFTVDLTNLITDDNANAGKTVTITYKAKVTDTKVSNKAGHDWDDEVNWDETKVFTGKITLTKKDAEDGHVLAGAGFEITRKNEDDGTYSEPLKFNPKKDNNGNILEGQYVYAPENGEVTEVVTGADGTLVVEGLDEGIYHFEEKTAPEGYSINASIDDVELTAGETAKEVFETSTEVKDTTLSELPSTGGMGTYLFTIVGVVIMAAAAGMLFMKRRGEAE